MKWAWFCNWAHLQYFSFFIYSLINCVTGEFLGDVDRKLAAPPAQPAVPWKCHCGALSLYFLDRRAEVGWSSLLKAMHSPFSLLFVVLLLSLVWGSREHTWLDGLAKVRAWVVLFSPSTPLLPCCLERLQSCWTELCNNPLLGEITWFHTNVPSLILLLCCQLSPCSFPGLQAQGFALRVEDLHALFCLLAWL